MSGDVRLAPEVATLAKAARLIDGKVLFPKAAFDAWREEHGSKAGETAERLETSLVALAIQFRREGGPGAVEAVAQLYVLTAGLIGRAAATKAFRAAGWVPTRKPTSAATGWKAKPG